MTDFRTVGDCLDAWEAVHELWDGPELTADDYNTVLTTDWADDEEYPR